jgi:hypothetical protein
MFHLHPFLLDYQKYPHKKHSTGLLSLLSLFPQAIPMPFRRVTYLTVDSDFE